MFTCYIEFGTTNGCHMYAHTDVSVCFNEVSRPYEPPQLPILGPIASEIAMYLYITAN